MSKDLLLRMKLEDSLTPKLKASIDAMQNLHTKTTELKTRLDTLRDNKQGFLKGTIQSDIDSLNKLKEKASLVRAEALKAKTTPAKKALDTKASKLEKDLLSAYNVEITKVRKSLALQGVEQDKLTFTTEKYYNTLIKQQETSASMVKATENAKQKEIKQTISERKKAVAQLHKNIKAEKEQRLAQQASHSKQYMAKLRQTIADKKRLATQTAVATKATNSLSRSSKGFGASISNTSNELVRHIRRLESYLVALYAIKKGYDATLGTGHEFNKLIERETIGLKLLISQNLAKVDSDGKMITSAQRYALAQTEANKAIEIARKINLKTPHSFAETLQIFKLLTPQVLKLGGSLEQVGTVTQRMSVIASSMGIEFQQFLKTVDSAMSGEMKESGLKRALEQFGVTNEGIKEIKKRNGDVTEYVIRGLEQAKDAGAEIFNSWAGATSQFKNEWEDLWGEIQKPIFEAMKDEIQDFSKILKDNKENILDTVDGLSTVAHQVAIVTTAYATLRVGTLAYSKVTAYLTANQLAQARAVKLANIQSTRQGVLITANTVKMRAMTTAMKGFALANAPLLALVVAFEAWSYATEKEEQALEKLNGTLDTTILKFGSMSDAIKKDTLNVLNIALDESDDKLKKLNIAINTLNSGEEFGFVYNDGAEVLTASQRINLSLKEQKALVRQLISSEREHNAEIVKKQLSLQSISPELQNALDKQREITKTSNMMDKSWLAMVNSVRDLSNTLDPLTGTYKTLTEEQAQQVLNLYNLKTDTTKVKDETDKLVASLSGAETASYAVADGVSSITSEMKKASKEAFTLADILIKGQLARGEITQGDALEQSYGNEVKRINNMADADKQRVEAIKAFEQQKTSLFKLEETQAKKAKRAEDTLRSARISNLESFGKDKEALALKIEEIEKSSVSSEVKKLNISKLINEAKKADVKSAEKGNKLSKDSVKNSKEELELEKAKQKLFETTHTEEEIAIKSLGDKLASMGKYLSQSDLADVYNAELKKMENATESLGDKIKKELGIDGGDSLYGALFENFLDSFSGIASAMNSNDPFAKSKASSSLITSSANLIVPGMGQAIETIGALFSSSLSEAEISLARGENEFDSQGLTTINDTLKSHQAPQLTATRSMLRHLESMDDKFGSIANALSSNAGFDYDGSQYEDTASGNWWGAESKELIGAGINFGEQTISAFIDGVDAVGYEAVKETSSSFFGLVSSEDIKQVETALPQSMTDDLSDAMGESIQAIMDSVDFIGLDSSSIQAEIDKFVLDLGKINFNDLDAEEKAQALSDAFSGQLNMAFEGAINSISSPQNASALNEMALIGEEYTATLVRAGVQHEIASTQLALFGQTVDDFATSDSLIQASGGLDQFKSSMAIFTENFFTGAEQKEFQRLQLEMALQTENVALPASEAQFKALVLETQQKIISVKATIATLKAEVASKVESGKLSLRSAYGELKAKGDIAQAQANVTKGQIGVNNNLVRSLDGNGSAVVNFGNNVNRMIDGIATGTASAVASNATTAIDEAGNVDYSRLTSVAIASAESELAELEGLYGTLMSNMGGFADYYGDVSSSASGATSALGDLAKQLFEIEMFKAKLTNDPIESARIELEAITKSTGLENLTVENTLSEVNRNIEALSEVTEATDSFGSSCSTSASSCNTLASSCGSLASSCSTGASSCGDLNTQIGENSEANRDLLQDYQDQYSALVKYQDALKAQRILHEDLWNLWSDSPIDNEYINLDRAQFDTGIYDATFENFADKMTDAMYAGDNLDDWKLLSDALMAVHDLQMRNAEEVLRTRRTTEDINNTWYEFDDVQLAESDLRFIQDNNNLETLNIDTFFQAFTEEQRRLELAGLEFTDEQSEEWSALSSAILTLNEATSKASEALFDLQDDALEKLRAEVINTSNNGDTSLGSLQQYIRSNDYENANEAYGRYIESSRETSLTQSQHLMNIADAYKDIRNLQPVNEYKTLEDKLDILHKDNLELQEQNKYLKNISSHTQTSAKNSVKQNTIKRATA